MKTLAEKMYDIYIKQGLIDAGIKKEDWVAAEIERQGRLKREVIKSRFTY